MGSCERMVTARLSSRHDPSNSQSHTVMSRPTGLELQERLFHDPDAFDLDKEFDHDMSTWHIRSVKYNVDTNFVELAKEAHMGLSVLREILFHNLRPYTLGHPDRQITYRPFVHVPPEDDGLGVTETHTATVMGRTFEPAPISELDIDRDRGDVRRTVRDLNGTSIEIIREQLGFSSDAKAIREAVETLAVRLVTGK